VVEHVVRLKAHADHATLVRAQADAFFDGHVEIGPGGLTEDAKPVLPNVPGAARGNADVLKLVKNDCGKIRCLKKRVGSHGRVSINPLSQKAGRVNNASCDISECLTFGGQSN
jgi:hypothetical protein